MSGVLGGGQSQDDKRGAMLSVDFAGKAVGDMSMQYMAKGEPPSYTTVRSSRPHEYIPATEQPHGNTMENKTQQHTINDILNSTKQGKLWLPFFSYSLSFESLFCQVTSLPVCFSPAQSELSKKSRFGF